VLILKLLILAFIALLLRVVSPTKHFGKLLMLLSIINIFWFQPSSPIRNLNFWIPVMSLVLIVISWMALREKSVKLEKHDIVSLAQIGVLLIFIGLTRYFPQPLCCIGASKPPFLSNILYGIATLSILVFLFYKFSIKRNTDNILIVLIIGIFLMLKNELLIKEFGKLLRYVNQQSITLGSSTDVSWIGYSYIAFRILHTVLDHKKNRLTASSLQDYLIYVLFFPTFLAGPIDRFQRFYKDLSHRSKIEASEIGLGGQRILVGLAKKFVVANTLSLIAISPTNYVQVNSSGWMILLIYAYALQIYFDFSGYTDIAIGISILLGFKIPENFSKPYLQPNLTMFWNSWHITLSQWFRNYFFNPVTKSMRKKKQPILLILLIGQFGTMILIGLWHSISWNLLIWGIWHGAGLFVQNRYSLKVRPLFAKITNNKLMGVTIRIIGVVITFNFVAFGWVWFVLKTPFESLTVFSTILGY
jgi:alginate O-acetyltransferase complex protein AlgI